ncbi:MAG: hypothetical protein Q8K74_09620 [Candidatus Nitrotoga sp.]|nr:hypothetical protein [Candidatus Nitrotoga sp.]MDP1856287.1 hypothetical protein [Candidatus Nitrotoga sp.]MDP3498554.1 hypothetical protein [Candidatus Nitrotoga sp.]
MALQLAAWTPLPALLLAALMILDWEIDLLGVLPDTTLGLDGV